MLPLYVGCIALLFGTTVACMRFVALHDAARTAARAAVTSDTPADAARDAVGDRSISLSVTETGDLITVTAERNSGVWWFARFLPSPVLRQSVTMMRETPIVLG